MVAQLENHIHDLEDRVASRTAQIESKHRQITSLLDNSGQGFLSFSADMLVHAECSRACAGMLGRAPEGMEVAGLLYPNDPKAAELVRAVAGRALTERDPDQRDIILSLLPEEIRLGDKVLRAQYRPLDDGRMMLVLTDVTAETQLAETLEEERRRLEMVVAAIADRGDLFETVETLETFLSADLPALLAATTGASAVVAEIYRQIHTFKGLFGQLRFRYLPPLLHQIEERLERLKRRGDALLWDDIAAAVPAEDIIEELDRDLAALRQALGDSFVEDRGRIALTVTQATRLEELAATLLRGGPIDVSSPDAREFLGAIASLRKLSLRAALKTYGDMVQQIAERVEKSVTLDVAGFDATVDPDAFRPFLRSLVHVFRNAVVHGIESPDDRLAAGKDETGIIACSVAAIDAGLQVEIADDGAGINVDALRARVVAAGRLDEQAPDEAVIDLIFDDGVSTLDQAGEYAGRGVGLSAVRREIERLGGCVTVETQRGKGTLFRFLLPECVDA
jgi:signal transduction histidine kinase